MRLEQVGATTLIYLEALGVLEPLFVHNCGKTLKILDTGYLWLFICEAGKNHIVTVQCDEEHQPVQWYVDIVNCWYLDDNGFATFEDLYLDVLRLLDGSTEIIDQSDVDLALHNDKVTQAQFDLAWKEAKSVERKLLTDCFEPVQQTEYYLSLFTD